MADASQQQLDKYGIKLVRNTDTGRVYLHESGGYGQTAGASEVLNAGLLQGYNITNVNDSQFEASKLAQMGLNGFNTSKGTIDASGLGNFLQTRYAAGAANQAAQEKQVSDANAANAALVANPPSAPVDKYANDPNMVKLANGMYVPKGSAGALNATDPNAYAQKYDLGATYDASGKLVSAAPSPTYSAAITKDAPQQQAQQQQYYSADQLKSMMNYKIPGIADAVNSPDKLSNPSYINALYKEQFGRDATAAELARFGQVSVKDAANIILRERSPFIPFGQQPKSKADFNAASPSTFDAGTVKAAFDGSTPAGSAIADKLSTAANSTAAQHDLQLQNLIDQRAQVQKDYEAGLVKTQKEVELDNQLTALRAKEDALRVSANMGANKIEDQTIPMELLVGQQASLQRQANAQLDSYSAQEKNLIAQLGLEQEARQMQLDVAKSKIDSNQQQIDLYFKMQDQINTREQMLLQKTTAMKQDARDTLALILEKFKGLDPKTLDAGTKDQLQGIATQLGLPLQMIYDGMAVMKTQQDFDNSIQTAQVNQQNKTANQKDYEYAKNNGYAGTFTDYQQMLLSMDPNNYQVIPGAFGGSTIINKTGVGGSSALNQGSTLQDFFNIYAPAGDNNNPVSYTAAVAQQTGLTPNTPLKSITDAQIPQLAKAIADHEGFTSGASRVAVANNNPGNLRFVGQAGATQGEGGFAKFANVQAGWQALQNDISAKLNRARTAPAASMQPNGYQPDHQFDNAIQQVQADPTKLSVYDPAQAGAIVGEMTKRGLQIPSAVESKAPSDAQNLAAGYALRMKQAGEIFDTLAPKISKLDSISYAVQHTAANNNLTSWLAPADMQSQVQAERNFINAQLRRESGAVISPAEFANAQKQYFPVAGDSEAVLAQKKQNRDTAAAALRNAAGPAYNNLQGIQSMSIAPTGAPNLQQFIEK